MDIVVTLQRLVGLGEPLVDFRPSLVQFAQRFEPAIKDSGFRACWKKLMSVVGEQAPDAALTGLLRFLSEVNPQQNAQICMNLDCTVAITVNSGQLCFDTHDGDVVCCRPSDMITALSNLCDSYDQTKGDHV